MLDGLIAGLKPENQLLLLRVDECSVDGWVGGWVGGDSVAPSVAPLV